MINRFTIEKSNKRIQGKGFSVRISKWVKKLRVILFWTTYVDEGVRGVMLQLKGSTDQLF